MGPPGSQGSHGLRGPQGPQRQITESTPQGPTGLQGATGSKGPPGDHGPQGPTGVSNYISQANVDLSYINFDQEPQAFSTTLNSLSFRLPRPMEYSVRAETSLSPTSKSASGPQNSNILINFGIPQAIAGPDGDPGGPGNIGISQEDPQNVYKGTKGQAGIPNTEIGPTGFSIKDLAQPPNDGTLLQTTNGPIQANTTVGLPLNTNIELNGFTTYVPGSTYASGQNVVVEPNAFFTCVRNTSSTPGTSSDWISVPCPGTISLPMDVQNYFMVSYCLSYAGRGFFATTTNQQFIASMPYYTHAGSDLTMYQINFYITYYNNTVPVTFIRALHCIQSAAPNSINVQTVQLDLQDVDIDSNAHVVDVITFTVNNPTMFINQTMAPFTWTSYDWFMFIN